MRLHITIMITLLVSILSGCELTNNEVKTSIFYSPHADDEVLSLGPSILYHKDKGHKIVVVLLSEGKASSAYDKLNDQLNEKELSTISRDEFANARAKEFKKSVEELGVKEEGVFIYQLPDGDIQKDSVKKIMKEMNERYPSAMNHVMSYRDPHNDHAATGIALKELMKEDSKFSGLFYIPVQEHKNIVSDGSFMVPDHLKKDFENSLNAYRIWDPEGGYYSIGYSSVRPYFDLAKQGMMSKWHK